MPTMRHPPTRRRATAPAAAVRRVARLLLMVLPALLDGPVGAPLVGQSPAVVAPREHPDLLYSDRHGESRRNMLDLFLPPAADDPGARPPLVVFVHGGSWTGGDKDRHAFIGRFFAANGLACATVNYRLAPFVQWPAFAEDVAAATAWLHAHGDDYGYDGGRICLIGHSAGGQIAAAIAYDPRWLRAVDADPAIVRGFAGLSGVYDLRPQVPLLRLAFGDGVDARSDASPIVHAGAGAPRTLLFWGERELKHLDLSGRMMAARLRLCDSTVASAELRGESHVSYLFRIGKDRDVIGERLVEFARSCCGVAGTAATPTRPRPAPTGGGRIDVRRDVTAGGDGAPHIDLHLPHRDGADPRSSLLLLAWIGGGGDDEERLLERIVASWAAAGLAVATLRVDDVAGDAQRTATNEVARALAWLHEHADGLGVAQDRLFLGGAGRGGALALECAFDPQWIEDQGLRARDVAGVVALSAAPSDHDLARRSGRRALLIACERDRGAVRALDSFVGAGARALETVALTLPGIDARKCLEAVGSARDALSPLVLGFVAR